MRILIIITDYGSFNNFLAELAVSLTNQNEVHVLCSPLNIINIVDKFDYSKFNITFHKIEIPRSTSILKLIKSGFKIERLVKDIKPNLVYAHFTTGIFPTVLFKKRKIQYWGAFHGLGMNASNGIRKLMFSIVELFCFFRLDKRFLINNKDYELVKNIINKGTYKYNSCGVGCDTEKFDKNKFSDIDQLNIKKKLNIENKFVITYTGRFVEFKGFDLVFQSFVKLDEEFSNQFVLILIGGKDPIHSTGLADKEEIELFKSDKIINIGYTSEVEKYLSITDVFLFPSKKEGLPVCIIEALAMGVPVITLDERGNSDVVIDGFNGYLIKSFSKLQDINEIFKKIKDLKSKSDILNNLSVNCLKGRVGYSRSLFVNEQLKLIDDFKLNKEK